MKLGRYMTAERLPCDPHDVWLVNDRRGALLATVEWYAPWRCYVMDPASGVVFNAECLAELARFCAEVVTVAGEVSR